MRNIIKSDVLKKTCKLEIANYLDITFNNFHPTSHKIAYYKSIQTQVTLITSYDVYINMLRCLHQYLVGYQINHLINLESVMKHQ